MGQIEPLCASVDIPEFYTTPVQGLEVELALVRLTPPPLFGLAQAKRTLQAQHALSAAGLALAGDSLFPVEEPTKTICKREGRAREVRNS